MAVGSRVVKFAHLTISLKFSADHDSIPFGSEIISILNFYKNCVKFPTMYDVITTKDVLIQAFSNHS